MKQSCLIFKKIFWIKNYLKSQFGVVFPLWSNTPKSLRSKKAIRANRKPEINLKLHKTTLQIQLAFLTWGDTLSSIFWAYPRFYWFLSVC